MKTTIRNIEKEEEILSSLFEELDALTGTFPYNNDSEESLMAPMSILVGMDSLLLIFSKAFHNLKDLYETYDPSILHTYIEPKIESDNVIEESQ